MLSSFSVLNAKYPNSTLPVLDALSFIYLYWPLTDFIKSELFVPVRITSHGYLNYVERDYSKIKSKNGILFNSENEVKNFINYLKTDFARSVLYFYKNSTQLIPATDYLPWFDFSDNVFSKSPKEIDNYLFKKYDISDEIRKHIEEILPDYYNIR